MSTPEPITTSANRSSGNETGNVGKTTIEDSVVAKIAGLAARDVPGVHALGGGAARAIGAIRGALNSRDLAQGVGVEVGDTQVAVDLTIVAEYPVALQLVADSVREAVYRAMEDLVGMEVTEVNVIINDVHIASDDADSTEALAGEPRVQRS